MEPKRIDELIAGHALGALSEEDERELEQHLRRSPEAREQLAAFEETASALAYAVEPPAPPARLRERILADASAAAPPNVVPLRRRWVVPTLAATAAAAAGVAIGLGIWGAGLSSSLSDERAAAETQSEVVALLTQSGSSLYTVDGAEGTLVVARDGEAGLVLRDVVQAPEGSTYQVWVVEGGEPSSAGLFEGGGDATIVPLTRPVPPGATVAVTVERDGGAPAPTSDPILAAPTA